LSAPLLASAIKNSSLHDREEIANQLLQSGKPDPQMQQMQMVQVQKQMQLLDAQIASEASKAKVNESQFIMNMVEAQLAPQETKAKVLSAISRNLPQQDDAATAEFNRRVQVAKLMLQEKDINSNEKIAMTQMDKRIQ